MYVNVRVCVCVYVRAIRDDSMLMKVAQYKTFYVTFIIMFYNDNPYYFHIIFEY